MMTVWYHTVHTRHSHGSCKEQRDYMPFVAVGSVFRVPKKASSLLVELRITTSDVRRPRPDPFHCSISYSHLNQTH